jgi:ABC-type glycerol-3-phosphate transport system substrate-binding protein
MAMTGYTGTLQVNVYGDWPFVKKNAADFMAMNPGLTITVGGITNDELNHQTVRTFVSTDAPDIASVTYSKDLMLQWLQAGAVVPLDDVWAADSLEAVTAPAFVTQATETDGKKYIVPLGLTIDPTNFYNKDAFTKAGVTAPSNPTRSWASVADWDANVAKLKAGGYTSPLSVFGDNTLYEVPLAQLLASECGAKTYTDMAANYQKTASADAPKYTDACAVKAFTAFKSWVENGWLAPGYPAVTYDQTVALFESKAAIWQSGSWAPPGYKPKFPWDWMAYPDANGGKPEMQVGLDSFVLPSGSKNQAAAKAFIAFMVTKSELETGMGRVPARPDVDLTKVIGNNPIEISIAEGISNYDTVPLWGLVVPTSVLDAGYQAWQGLVDGSMDPASVAKAFQTAVDTYKASHP